MKHCLKLWETVGVFFSAAMLMLPVNASADISVTEQGTTAGNIAPGTVTRIFQVKGLRMRVETLQEGQAAISIYDLEAGKKYRLEPKRKEVFVADLASQGEHWRGRMTMKNVRSEVKLTGKKAEIGGIACDEYVFDLQVLLTPDHGKPMITHEKGKACVSHAVPNKNELANFVHEAQKRGYTTAAAMCSLIDTGIATYFYGEEPNAMVISVTTKSVPEDGSRLFNGMGFSTLTIKILAIGQNPLPEELFQVPTDWKVKKDSLPM